MGGCQVTVAAATTAVQQAPAPTAALAAVAALAAARRAHLCRPFCCAAACGLPVACAVAACNGEQESARVCFNLFHCLVGGGGGIREQNKVTSRGSKVLAVPQLQQRKPLGCPQ
eukprot:1140553-Pelagomonas_calceolata.AAC.4